MRNRWLHEFAFPLSGLPTILVAFPILKQDSPSKPAPGRLEAIEAQIRDEIAVMQGVMICDLRQDEHLVRLDAPEVARVIEVRIGEPGVHAVAVAERAFEVGHDLGLRTLHGSHCGGRFTLCV